MQSSQNNQQQQQTPSQDLNGMSFKAQLKKVEPKRMNKDAPKDDITTSIIDFKSRLRKVDQQSDSDNNTSEDVNSKNKSDSKIISDELTSTCNNNNNKTNKPNNNSNNNIIVSGRESLKKKTEIKIDVVVDSSSNSNNVDKKPKDPSSDEDDNKRKSTGSISSLKKLWEAKENTAEHVNQLSPKMAHAKNDDNHNNNNNNNNSNSSSPNGHDSCMEPPVAKKPAVPVKPSKFSIYATPIQQQHQPQQQASKGMENNNHSNMSSPASRECILELVQMVECNLKIPVNLITATQWLQLSDKLNIIQSSCVTYADTETMPPHTKFQFRELVTRVENQSNCLRTAGQKNVQDNEKLLIEVGQSLKQLSNALHR
jgi:abelson tyrosine-protein kinase 1